MGRKSPPIIRWVEGRWWHIRVESASEREGARVAEFVGVKWEQWDGQKSIDKVTIHRLDSIRVQ